MAKGLPKSIIKKYGISKKAWSVFRSRKNKGTKRSSKTRRKSNPKRRIKRVARKKRSRRYSMTIPLAPIAGLAAGLAEPAQKIIGGDLAGGLNLIGCNYTGYDAYSGSFNLDHLKRGLLPLIVGLLVHKFVGGAPLNLNRVLARAKVPFIRL